MGKHKENRKKIYKIRMKKEALERRIKELSSLYRVSKDIDEIKDVDELLKDVAAITYNAMGSFDPFFIIWVFDKKNRKKIKTFEGVNSFDGAEILMRKSGSFVVPLKVGGEKRGGFVAGYKRSKNMFDKEEKEFIREVADLVGKEIERRKVKDDLNRMFIEVIKTLSAALDARDQYTVNHSRKISESCRLIAERLKINDKEKENIILGALLHDIGKIGISDGILGKPSGLTAEEFDKVKKHPLISERILKPIEALKGSLKIIRHHHEHYDGKGYPDGLKGEKIPLGARILSVCDAYDAMISERPYRGAMSVEKAVKELRDNSGIQFDPQIVKVMVSLIERDFFQ